MLVTSAPAATAVPSYGPQQAHHSSAPNVARHSPVDRQALGPGRKKLLSSPPAAGSGDVIVAAAADKDGYHLFTAHSSQSWRWRPLASLQPGGYSGEPWIGNHCLTGDGKSIVAVVAPWHANNSPGGLGHGGLAYAVDIATGKVRPLAAKMALTYFNPGCGAGDDVALTRFTGAESGRTTVLTAQASTGNTRTVGEVPQQLTAAVPVSDGVYAARGDHVVRLNGDRAQEVFSVPGQAFRLTPAAGGRGLDLLVAQADRKAQVWHWNGRSKSAHEVAEGGLADLRLLPGRNGRNRIVGAAENRQAAETEPVGVPAGTWIETGSLDGTALLGATVSGVDGRRLLDGQGRTLTPDLPKERVRPYTKLPPAPDRRKAVRSSGTKALAADEPVCAVPRNDIFNQVPQPSYQQVEWAANRAGRGTLVGVGGGALRPGGAFNLSQPGYSPSRDFPLPAPFGTNGDHIPREVISAVFAQETNWAQASWHVRPGLSGNPLIADYYGSRASEYIDYSQADCGYGLGQITDLMRMGATGQPSGLQRKIAVDYAENAAAAAQVLARKWNQLGAAGITVDAGNPGSLENWYFAVWAYNSGVNPQGSTGNTSGCTPGPGCTDADGNWGMGWTNNPANPNYDPQRHPFLHVGVEGAAVRTFDDARHPQDWPYQEKIFGWMESGQQDLYDGGLKFEGTYDYATQTGALLALPNLFAMCDQTSSCDSQVLNPLPHAGICQRADYHCWWHRPIIVCVVVLCHGGTDTVADNAPEPSALNPSPPVCGRLESGLPPDTVIVDNQAAGVNLVGCSRPDWTNGGRFSVARGISEPGGPDGNDVDWHQLGVGFGGHAWFTHTYLNGVPAQWSVEATWQPDNLARGRYRVYAFVPSDGAWAMARYVIHNGRGATWAKDVNQELHPNSWTSLGTYWLGSGAKVTLNNITSNGFEEGDDIGFDAVAFAPVSAPGTLRLLGDSFSAGEGTLTYDLETNTSENKCHRSGLSWQRRFQSGSSAYHDIDWRQVACSGALLADYEQPNHSGNKGEGPQRDVLDTDTGMVMLTLGGNDAGFARVLANCVLNRWTSDCRNKYTETGTGVDLVLRDILDLQPKLSEFFTDLRRRAPDAEINVLTYPVFFVEHDSERRQGCIDDGVFSEGDRQWFNYLTRQMDALIVREATRAGVNAIDMSDVLKGHELCTDQSWMTGILDTLSKQEWVHPNRLGHQAMYDRVRATLQTP
ncbi:GDSL-type esterase/lipase family protein [Streptosporangium sp. NPDC000239]|uniref:GDSL-type esterase/lipase family protein n=1 Tax=unclassified Streptosporangium TaxID=2632669 RepID=UPI00331BE67C